MPDFYSPGNTTLPVLCGNSRSRQCSDGSTIKPGDAVLGVASSGLHSNGYSLVRKVLLERRGYALDAVVPDLGKPLGDELITPTVIYVKPVLELCRSVHVKGMAHITAAVLWETYLASAGNLLCSYA